MINVSILVASITTVLLPSETGRYVSVTPIGSFTYPVGKMVECIDRKGRKVQGRVVDMSGEIEAGHFPRVAGVVLDTHMTTDIVKKPMRAGGIAGAAQERARKYHSKSGV
jgi:hypothetical protein